MKNQNNINKGTGIKSLRYKKKDLQQNYKITDGTSK